MDAVLLQAIDGGLLSGRSYPSCLIEPNTQGKSETRKGHCVPFHIDVGIILFSRIDCLDFSEEVVVNSGSDLKSEHTPSQFCWL